MNFKYLIYFLLAAFSVTASNIDDITTWSRIKYPFESLKIAYEFPTSRFRYSTEKRRYLLSTMISKKSDIFFWQDLKNMALLVEDFMAIGADLNTLDYVGNHLLMAAALSGNLEVVTLLLDYGADVNAICYFGLTALSISIAYRRKQISYLLLKRGANPFIGDALHRAIRLEFFPDRFIPYIRMIEPDSELANRLAHVFVEDEFSLSTRRYLNPSRPCLDACLDNITNKERLDELFQKAVKKCRVSLVQALLERGCSWRQLNLKAIFVFLRKDIYYSSSTAHSPTLPVLYSSAMAKFVKMGVLEGVTFYELKALLCLLRTIRCDALYTDFSNEFGDLYAEVLRAYREKEGESSYWICNIS